MTLLVVRRKGGPGSGNFGHAGRPGKIGGSALSSSTASKSGGIAPNGMRYAGDFFGQQLYRPSIEHRLSSAMPRIRDLEDTSTDMAMIFEVSLQGEVQRYFKIERNPNKGLQKFGQETTEGPWRIISLNKLGQADSELYGDFNDIGEVEQWVFAHNYSDERRFKGMKTRYLGMVDNPDVRTWASYNRPGPSTVYKGVPAAIVASIEANGLKRGHSWLGRNPSVYFTTNYDTARTYGDLFASGDIHHKMYGIVKFKIPDSVDKSVIWDEMDMRRMGISNAFRIEQDIPADWIDGVDLYEYRDGKYVQTSRKELPIGKMGYAVILIENESVERKGGPGSGNFGHAGRPGEIGGSAASDRVWGGKQAEGTPSISKLEAGRLGEKVAIKALIDRYNAAFSSLNVGINNAPIDLGGDHTAVEVKTGIATNGLSAQHWRATIGQPGKREAALLKQMSPEQKREWNARKGEQIIKRKMALLDNMAASIGGEMRAVTVGVILSADGSRADVFFIPGFHLRLGWNKYATDEYYAGSYDV